MVKPSPVREAPIPGPLEHRAAEETGRQNEPFLAIDQIQGNIFPGFRKDHQTLLFLRITDPKSFAQWLAKLTPLVTRMEDVVPFNRLFKALRRRQQAETGAPQATWLNVAFSFAALQKLKPKGVNLGEFVDEAFKTGMLKRTQEGLLGDPSGEETPGAPENWVVGGPGKEADAVLILAGDDREELYQEVGRLVASLFPSLSPKGLLVTSGAEIIFRQDGNTLTGPLRGHEHFGFLDGVSQPGIRGLLPDGTPLTPSQNPLDANQGKPGQDLLWPGEFVFGYPGQDGNQEVEKPGPDPLQNPKRKAPEFARNGSFLVFRRLRQHVGMLHRFLQTVAGRFQVLPDLVGAKMVGRWSSGAPAVVTPNQDDPALANDDCKNNNFEYDAPAPGDVPPSRPPGPEDCMGVTPPPNDPLGQKVPFAGHIRKAYPRNDQSSTIPSLKEQTTQTHRLLRRGIPYGEQSASTPHLPVDDDVDRGLLFLAYQASLADQFEFVTRNWVNNPNFKQNSAGFDPIIGQNNAAGENRVRTFSLSLPGETQPITTDQDWVVPTGGGYFFAPSIMALQILAGLEPDTKKQPVGDKAKIPTTRKAGQKARRKR
jgi:Dyp-type peroxidase family